MYERHCSKSSNIPSQSQDSPKDYFLHLPQMTTTYSQANNQNKLSRNTEVESFSWKNINGLVLYFRCWYYQRCQRVKSTEKHLLQ